MATKQKNGAAVTAAKVCHKTAKERLHGFWNVFEKEDEVLICINADPDALASAMAIRQLLRYRVKNVVITHPNEIRRLNNIVMVQRLKIPLERLSGVKLDAFTKKVLVDSQPKHLPCFEKIKFDVVIDHHPVTGDIQAGFIDIRPDYGAASSMLVEYLRAAGIKPTVATATALFYGIKVDTRNFETQSRLADGISFRYLFTLANRDLVKKIELTDLRRSELKYFCTGLTDLKYSNRCIYSHLGKVRSPDVLVMIADFLNHVDEVDWVFVSGIHGERLVVIFRCDGYRKNAGKLAVRIFGAVGSAGGHKESARAEVPLKNLALEGQEFTSATLKRLTTRHMK
jgi:nanoRNase/pAp phosphatase (c-di-AMP/oligoRNAs hydrolase)